MLRCKKCKVPLDGLLSVLGKVFLGIKPSSQDPQMCNKCLSPESSNAQDGRQKDKPSTQAEGNKYKCQLCERMVHEDHALEHIKAEEYIIKLINKDHPQWKHKDPLCRECIAYYRKLVDNTEI